MNNTKILADGQLPISKTALYTCPAGRRAIVYNIKVMNVSGGNNRFLLYIKKVGGTSRNIVDYTTGSKHRSVDDDVDPLEAGDAIEGQSPGGSTQFDYVINGYEEIPIITS